VRPPAVCALLLALLFGPAAGAAHITDQLAAGLYPTPLAEGTPLQLLTSGTAIEVLARSDGFARVRLADGTEGWVEEGYVTDRKPAAAELRDARARLRLMGLELAALRESAAADDAGHESGGAARIWVVSGAALLVGFVAGAAYVDYRNRKRHGGFRV
jgi:hypothetical protein